jgi:threonine dehydratase
VTEFNYRYGDEQQAHIFVGVGLTRGAAERAELLSQLTAAALPAIDMTHNEMAKLHVRHMVGGRAIAEGERLFRFEFPERPGALMRFLTTMGGRWNISLFHYRNHGAAFGRVLAGMQVRDDQSAEFAAFLRELEYACVEETDNPAYRLFLR